MVASKLTDGGQIIRPRESLVLYNHSIFSELRSNTTMGGRFSVLVVFRREALWQESDLFSRFLEKERNYT